MFFASITSVRQLLSLFLLKEKMINTCSCIHTYTHTHTYNLYYVCFSKHNIYMAKLVKFPILLVDLVKYLIKCIFLVLCDFSFSKFSLFPISGHRPCPPALRIDMESLLSVGEQGEEASLPPTRSVFVPSCPSLASPAECRWPRVCISLWAEWARHKPRSQTRVGVLTLHFLAVGTSGLYSLSRAQFPHIKNGSNAHLMGLYRVSEKTYVKHVAQWQHPGNISKQWHIILLF